VLPPARGVTGTEMVRGSMLPMPLTAASAGGAPLTETKNERSLITVSPVRAGAGHADVLEPDRGIGTAAETAHLLAR